MPKRPIILFGEPNPANRKSLPSGLPGVILPTHTKQAARLEPKMAALQQTVLTLQQTPVGIEPEKALVFELAKDEKSFFTAVKNLGDGIELIFDAPYDVAASDDFYVYKKDKKTGEIIKRKDKDSFRGKIYCIITNARALEEMLQLWARYGKDSQTPFPRGKTGLKNVFDCLIDVHTWGYKERFEETGILEVWNDELKDPDVGNVRCEIELFFSKSVDTRNQRENDLNVKIIALGGTVDSRSVIEEIGYHAVLATIPRNVVEQVIKKSQTVSLLSAEQIMFLRPVGQNVYTPEGTNAENRINVPNADNIHEEPIIALFDGLPQENHPFLSNRLVVDDPDDYTSNYTVSARKHGTSMASLIALGDLSNIVSQATHKIYIRPIMKPLQMPHDILEEIPGDTLLVDKIHEAVRRLFVSEDGAVASTVKVINLSIGITYRQFNRVMSPLARLLDWLSYTYRVLFVVSAGNHSNNLNLGVEFGDFAALNMDERDTKIFEWVNNNARNRRLLSPAESLNALTVGATFEDSSAFTENSRFVLPCSDEALNPISAIGKGLNNSIKPDIIYPGGRNVVMDSPANPGIYQWRTASQREPGTLSAAPSVPGIAAKVAYSFGTSNSAALISHEASRCYDALTEIFADSDRPFPDGYIALLIKAMLIHGAEWGIRKDNIMHILGLVNRNQYPDVIHRFIGYGKPNIERAIECAKKRITLIGYGELPDGSAHLYDLPLPFNFNSERIARRLTVTLTSFTPIVPSRQSYRAAQVWYSIEKKIPKLIDSRVDASDKAVTRGSVQHEIFENNEIVTWGEDDFIQIKVNCRADAVEHLEVAIPYALMVSFEIKSDIDVDVYTKIAEKVRPRIHI